MHRASVVVRRAIARVAPSTPSSSLMLTQQRQTTRTHASVAVVGGGLAGVACACELKRLGVERVVVFDGGRALGGRASARVADGGVRWDHGARFIERDVDDASAWETYIDDGVAKGYFKPWVSGAFGAIDARTGVFIEESSSVERLVGDLGFGAACEAATKDAGVDVRTSARVVGFERQDTTADDQDGGVSVRYKSAAPGDGDDAKTSSGYRVVVLADKNLASERIIRAYGERPPIESLGVPEVARAMRDVKSKSVLALMVTLNRDARVSFVGADVDGNDTLLWIANESSKPGRARDTSCWVAHSTDAYAASVLSRSAMDTRVGTAAHEDWLADATTRMSDALLNVLRAAESANSLALDLPPLEITYARAHRWGAAFPTSIAKGAESKKYLQSGNVYAVGDWCVEPNARGAVTSGLAAAAAIAHALNARAKL